MENCTILHVCDSPVYSHTAATLHLEINQYEGSRVIGLVVCRWLFVPWPEFTARAVHMECVVNTVTNLSLNRAVSFLPLYFHSTSVAHSVFYCLRTDNRHSVTSSQEHTTIYSTGATELCTQDITLCDYASWFTARLPFPSTETHVVCAIFQPRQPPSTHARTHTHIHNDTNSCMKYVATHARLRCARARAVRR